MDLSDHLTAVRNQAMRHHLISKTFYHLASLALVIALLSGVTRAQSASPAGLGDRDMPARLDGEWRASGQSELKESEDWRLTTDQLRGEILTEYGLDKVITRRYHRNNSWLRIRLFVFRQTAGAFGWWTFVRRVGESRQRFLQYGKVVIESEFEGKPLTDEKTVDEATLGRILESLKGYLPPDDGQIPVLPAHLPGPDAGLVAGTEVYLAGPKALAQDPQFGERVSVIDFSGLPDIVTADYRQGSSVARLLLVEYHTPQAATESLRLWDEYQRRATLPTGEPPRTVRRIGNYIAELAGNPDQSFAQALLSRIRYEQRVYWAGRKVSDIPLEFRPLDSSVLREATRTGTIIVQSLIWIGMMMAIVFGSGLVVGGIFFYWRRFREKRKGTDKLFSDGGGSIVLNLQDKE